MAMTLLPGPVASGKSRLAADLATRWAGPVAVVATAEALDEEMRERIERHRLERPEGWVVHEEPLDLSGAIEGVRPDAFAIVDCLTLWTSNMLRAEVSPGRVVELAVEAAEVAAARPVPTVVVTNEVGWGIVPANDLARVYRDLLGRVNRAFADRAADVRLVVAGRAVALPPIDPEDVPV
jgi:adenosyl cobinamide kinase/adenosyl cobinamide phosphate guanylyltransferase